MLFDGLINWVYKKRSAAISRGRTERIRAAVQDKFTLSRQTNFGDITDMLESHRERATKLPPGALEMGEVEQRETPVLGGGELQRATYHLRRLVTAYKQCSPVRSDRAADVGAMLDKLSTMRDDFKVTRREVVASLKGADERHRIRRAVEPSSI